MSERTPPLWQDGPPPTGADLQLERVVEQSASWTDGATAAVLRDTLDQLLDGQRTAATGRASPQDGEDPHGTLVEINLHRAFNFDDGSVTDYRIAGIEVDCQFSRSFGGWEIPLEAYGHLCLVIWATTTSQWSAGVVRIRGDYPQDLRQP